MNRNRIRTVHKYGNSVGISLTGIANVGEAYKITERDGLIILAPVVISQPCVELMEKLDKDNL